MILAPILLVQMIRAISLCEGTYFVTVTDMSNGCSITDTLIADFFIPNGIIDLSTTTVFSDFDLWGYAPYSYLWMMAQTVSTQIYAQKSLG